MEITEVPINRLTDEDVVHTHTHTHTHTLKYYSAIKNEMLPFAETCHFT